MPDQLDVIDAIVSAAMEASPDGTLVEAEERRVAVAMVEWIEGWAGDVDPTPEEVARHAIGEIICQALLSELGDEIRSKVPQSTDRLELERQIGDSAQSIAQSIEISPRGLAEDELSRSIEDGLDLLKEMVQEELK